MAAGGSAHTRAEELRAQAARARAQADALEAEAGAWSAGAEGERRVAASLGRLGHGWYVHHDRLLRPGRGQTNLDHVVVGPSGVYLVDTKNWAGGTSVHENNLWQHTSKSSPKGRELDNVSRFAAEMERGLGLPVVPVIALAGSQASSFGRQRVRGVEIIPSDELVAWLLAQPATSDAVGTELLSRRVAHAYPPASPEVAGDPDTTGWTVAGRRRRERDTSATHLEGQRTDDQTSAGETAGSAGSTRPGIGGVGRGRPRGPLRLQPARTADRPSGARAVRAPLDFRSSWVPVRVDGPPSSACR